MSKHEIKVTNQTWKLITAKDPTFEIQGNMLFKNFFDMCPQAMKIFNVKKDDNLMNNDKLRRHGALVLGVIDKCVSRDLKANLQEFRDLGKRHIPRKVKPQYFDMMGQAFVNTFQEILGDKAFTRDARAAWTKFFGIILSEMARNVIE